VRHVIAGTLYTRFFTFFIGGFFGAPFDACAISPFSPSTLVAGGGAATATGCAGTGGVTAAGTTTGGGGSAAAAAAAAATGTIAGGGASTGGGDIGDGGGSGSASGIVAALAALSRAMRQAHEHKTHALESGTALRGFVGSPPSSTSDVNNQNDFQEIFKPPRLNTGSA
jgi:hypothetical protein